jgi:hypothetical protein
MSHIKKGLMVGLLLGAFAIGTGIGVARCVGPEEDFGRLLRWCQPAQMPPEAKLPEHRRITTYTVPLDDGTTCMCPCAEEEPSDEQ